MIYSFRDKLVYEYDIQTLEHTPQRLPKDLIKLHEYHHHV